MRLLAKWRHLVVAVVLALSTAVSTGVVPLSAPAAHAGVDYWSQGCRGMWWYQTRAMVDWQVWTSHPYVQNGVTLTVTGAIRRSWRNWANECGSIGVPAANEQYEQGGYGFCGPFGCRNDGWHQWFSGVNDPGQGGSNAVIFWDRLDCRYSFVQWRTISTVWSTGFGDLCRFA